MSGSILLHRLDELLRRDLHAEVDHVEAGTFEHDVDEVLADVVDVAFHGSHHEGADGLDAGLGEEGAEPLEGSCHRFAGDEHLGHEEVTPLEAGTDLLERRDERLEEQRLGGKAHLEAGVGQLENLGRIADKGEVVQLLQQFVAVHAAPSCPTRNPSAAERRRTFLDTCRRHLAQAGRAEAGDRPGDRDGRHDGPALTMDGRGHGDEPGLELLCRDGKAPPAHLLRAPPRAPPGS